MNNETEEVLETLGLLVDNAENYLMYKELAVTSDVKINALINGLTEIRDQIKQLYFDLGGQDVWDFED